MARQGAAGVNPCRASACARVRRPEMQGGQQHGARSLANPYDDARVHAVLKSPPGGCDRGTRALDSDRTPYAKASALSAHLRRRLRVLMQASAPSLPRFVAEFSSHNQGPI